MLLLYLSFSHVFSKDVIAIRLHVGVFFFLIFFFGLTFILFFLQIYFIGYFINMELLDRIGDSDLLVRFLGIKQVYVSKVTLKKVNFNII